MVDCHDILPEHYQVSSIKHQGTRLRRGFFIHEYFSCDRRKPNRVRKLFDAITLRVYEKITSKNTGKPGQYCAALKHYCLRLLPDLFHRMTVGLVCFAASFCSIKARPWRTGLNNVCACARFHYEISLLTLVPTAWAPYQTSRKWGRFQKVLYGARFMVKRYSHTENDRKKSLY